jgi:hypothetical protein
MLRRCWYLKSWFLLADVRRANGRSSTLLWRRRTSQAGEFFTNNGKYCLGLFVCQQTVTLVSVGEHLGTSLNSWGCWGLKNTLGSYKWVVDFDAGGWLRITGAITCGWAYSHRFHAHPRLTNALIRKSGEHTHRNEFIALLDFWQYSYITSYM